MDKLTILAIAAHQPRRAMILMYDTALEPRYPECAACVVRVTTFIEDTYASTAPRNLWGCTVLLAQHDRHLCNHCRCELEFFDAP